MTAINGRKWLLKLGVAGAGGTLAAVITANATFNGNPEEITTKDSGGWREFGEDFGTKSFDIDIDGIFSDSATFESFKQLAEAQTINGFLFVNTSTADTDSISGNFIISNFNLSTSEKGAAKFSCKLMSSGAITFTNT